MALLIVALPAAHAPVHAQQLFESEYIHSIYNLSSPQPVRIYSGRVAHDLSQPKWWRQALGELRALGVNQTAPLVTYGTTAIYPTQIRELQQSAGWAELGVDPLQMLLDACQEFDVACFPDVWLYKDASPELSQKVIRELIARYGDHPAFEGIVPGVESSGAYGITSEDYVALSRLCRQLKPGVTVMDYPNGPFSPHILQTIMARSLSGEVDIENIQFHPSDRRWDGSFAFARGLTHLVMGLTPGIRSICHTHYKYGGGLRWIQLDDLYRVHQAATLTATPDGTSIFLFTGCMYGRVSAGDLTPTMPRRLSWYEGILAVQRMVPYFEDARPANAVGIMIPRHIRESSLELIEAAWMPLAREAIGAHFLANDSNLGERTQALIVRGLQWCSPEQVRLIERFVVEGGAACVFSIQDLGEPEHLDERTRRVLGETFQVPWQPAGVSAEFAEVIGLDDRTGAIDLTEPREVLYGEGSIYLAPLGAELPEGFLPRWAREHAPGRTVAVGLGEGLVMDTWRKSDRNTDLQMVMFMGTTPGLQDENVVVSLASDLPDPSAWLLTPDTVQPLSAQAAGGRVEVGVPRLRDEFNALIVSESTYPFIVPESRLLRCRTGETVQVHFGVLNALDRELQGSLDLIGPLGWPEPEPSSIEVDLEPGSSATLACSLRVPEDAMQAPHFLHLELSGLRQRVMLYPEDGRPQRFTDQPEEELVAAERTSPILPPPAPRQTIGEDWLEVTADDPASENVRVHSPGVCFLPGPEWDRPTEHEGRTARYGEHLPRLGGPNFLVNDPPARDIEVRLTYFAHAPGSMSVYDGEQYQQVAELDATGEWATATARVAREIIMSSTADRPQHPGLNIMFDVDCPGVWVHSIEVRAVPVETGAGEK
ncbi:MAG: hypothetical protein ACP5KN_03750 [Armatimonadota bacterium]